MESESPGKETTMASDTERGGGEGGGETVLVVEHKSLRSFTTNDEYLYAMKEDLADWFAFLYKVPVDAESFFAVLETGVVLCRHANEVQHFFKQRARQLQQQEGTNTTDTILALAMRSYFIRNLPENEQVPVQYRNDVAPGTFQARDNVSNFIAWCRQLGIPDVLRFETDDLVMRKNEKSVILCLLELARVGAKLGMPAPTLVRMEQEIEQELQEEEEEAGRRGRRSEVEEEEEEMEVVVLPPTPPPPSPPRPQQPQPQILTCDMKSLDELVRDLVGRCTCPVQFPMVKVGEGKYQIGDSRALIFVRVLRNHVMVRVGGGWDTLENYLNKHDPCRCQFKGHRGGASGASGIRHQIIRRSSTTSLIAARASTASPLPTTPTTPRKTPSLASVSPSQSGLKGSHSEHASFTKGPSPSRTGQIPTSHSFHKGLSPARSSSPGPGQADLLTPGRNHGQGLVSILKNSSSNPACGSPSAEFDGVRRLPTSASSQSFKEMRESRESSLGRDSARVSSRPSSPRQGEDRPKPSQLPQRCKSPSPGVGEGRCLSPGVAGNRSLLPRAVGVGGSGIPRPVSPVSTANAAAGVARRPHSSLSKSVSFDTTDRFDDDTDQLDNKADAEVASQMTPNRPHYQGQGDKEVLQMDQINTMTLSEFRKLVQDNLSVEDTPDISEHPTPKSSRDEAGRNPLKRSVSADPQTSSWQLVRDKARSVCSSFASRLSGKKPASGGGASNILVRRTPPKSPSMGARNPSSTTAERPQTPSTAERPKTPVLTPRPKTPTTSSSRPKIPVASIKPEVKASSRPQTPSRPKISTAVGNHSNVGSSSNAGGRNPLVRASSADPGYSESTMVVNSNTLASGTCTNAPSYVENNIYISSPDCRAKNSSFVYTSVESSNFGHTRVTGITLQSQFYLSSSDDERQSESSDTAEEENQKQTVSVSVSRSTTPVSSRIPKPSFIPRATTPVSTSCGVSQEPGRCNGSLVARGGRARPSALVGRSSVERQLSAEKGDGEKQPTTPRTPRRRPQTPNYSSSSAAEGNRVRRAQTPGLENSSSLASSGMRTPRATTPGPEVSSSKTKTNLDFVTLRRDSRKKKENKWHHRRSRSLTDLLQAVEAVSKEVHKESPSLKEKNGSTLRAVSTNARPRLQKQKACDAEVLMISRNSQGLHSVRIPDQNEMSASPQTRRKLQPSASLDVDRVRSRTPGPLMEYQPRSILRKPAQPAQKESDIYCRVTSRTEAWVDSTLHDPKRKLVSNLRRPMTPNSLSVTESELLSRPLEEIRAALPSPTKVPPAVDREDMFVLPEDPEMYTKMEMLFEKYREMELRASVRDTPGGSQDNISGVASKSSSSHVSSGGQGQEVLSSSTSSYSASPMKAGTTLVVNTVSFSSGISSVRSCDTDSSQAMSLEERFSRDSSPSRAPSSLHTNEGASTSGDVSDPSVLTDQASASVTPRPQQPPPTPVDSLLDVDAETIARNPSALVSKIKEILQIRPRKDNKEKAGLRTRIPAPTPTTPRTQSVMLTPGAEPRESPAVFETIPNGYDASRDDASSSDVSSECSRSETPVSRLGRGKFPLTQTPVRLFDKKQNGSDQSSSPVTHADCPAASPFDDNDQYF